MKNNNFFFWMACICASCSLLSCDKSSENENNIADALKNNLSYNNLSYDVSTGKLWYQGANNQDSSIYFFDVFIMSADSKNFIRIQMNSLLEADLMPGTYMYAAVDKEIAPSFFDGIFVLNYNPNNDSSDLRLELSGGQVKVEKSGSTYEITLDIETQAGKVTGYYKGTLIYEDKSK